ILRPPMRGTPGLRVGGLVVENVPMPVVQMAVDPQGTLGAVANLPDAAAADEPGERAAHVPTPRKTLIRMQLGLAAVPVVLFVVDNLVNGGIPFLSNNTWSFFWGLI